MPNCEVRYPQEVPVDCIRELVSIIRSGRIRQAKAEFAKHVWSVQGFLQSKVFGDPDLQVVGVEPEFDDEDLCRLLESVADPTPQASAALPLPAALLLRWLLIKLLERLA